VLVGLVAAVVAAVLPLAALLLAGRWATGEVTARTLAGSRATATAVGEQVDQSYEDALTLFRSTGSRPSLVKGLAARDRATASAGLTNVLQSGPFTGVGLFDGAGHVVAQVPAGRSAPAPDRRQVSGRAVGAGAVGAGAVGAGAVGAGAVGGAVVGGPVVEGPLREVGRRSLRSLTVAVGGPAGALLGYVTADVDLQRLIADPGALRFGRTGKSTVVGTDTRVIANSTASLVGIYLRTPVNQRLARAHVAGSATVTSVLTHQHVIEVYQPVAGRPWGVLTSQTTAEAFAGADRLTRRLQLLALVVAGLGLLLAGSVTAMVSVRDRRIRNQTRALAAAKEVFASAFDNAPTGVALISLDGRFLQVNRSLCELTGYSEEQLLARSFTQVTHPDDRGPDEAGARALVAGELDHLVIEKRYLRADGAAVWVAVRSSLVSDGNGRADHFIGHITDITERHAAAAAMVAANRQLEVARDAAIASTMAKSAFLATMSHEIRTPMNAVIGMTGLLLDTELDAEQREFTETVRTSGDALLVIINNILDFSKIETGEVDLELFPFGLRDCVESSLSLLALPAAEKGIELVAELAAGCPEQVVGDVTRFRQVLVNLLSNAVKFTSRGEIHVLVSGERLTAAEDGPVRLTVAVRDTGIGVPADRLDRLFRPFSQVDSSTTRLYGGTGLGLVISRRLAVAMGGDLQVASESGVGSTFTFTAVLTGAADRRAARAAPQTGPPRTLAGRSVLVVDDNATNRRVLSVLLAQWGAIGTEAAEPAEALRMVEEGRHFDVAVLDMHMPGMDGAQLAAELRRTPAGAVLPLLLLSSLQSRLPAAQRALFVSTLTKPARADVLHDAIVAALLPADAVLDAIETAGGRRSTDGAGLSYDTDGAAVSRDTDGASLSRDADGAAVSRDTDGASLSCETDGAAVSHDTGGAAVSRDTGGTAVSRDTGGAAVSHDADGPAVTADPGGDGGAVLSLRVLLAEDNPVNQKVATFMLHKLGHRVDVVANGLEAVDAVRRVAYDVVLMDVQMPELDGIGATRAIRADLDTHRQPPIVAMTANVLPEDRAACTAAGMDGHLPKPVRLPDLALVLGDLPVHVPA